MSKLWSKVFLLILLLPLTAGAFAAKPKAAPSATTTTTTFQAGKDYEVLKTSLEVSAPKSSVHVTEFFSLGCPACYHFEPTLEAWLAKKPKYVMFERVPVVFEQNWDIYARAYYAMRTLGVAEKLVPLAFNAIHKEGQTFDTPAAWEEFVVKHGGVSKQDFENAYEFSPGIDAQIMRGNDLLRKYQIMEIPTMLIEDKYKVTPRMTNGDAKRMLEIVDYLVQKEKAGK